MSLNDIDNVVEAFVKGARVASKSGFDGVQLHAAHGYLIAQFISPKSNERTDGYSSRPENALRLLKRIVSAIRSVVSKDFVVGIKINCADYTDDHDRHALVLDHFRTIAAWGEVDFIEVSGGDYEKPDFLATQTRSPRQALFSHFSRTAMDAIESLKQESTLSAPLPLILLTGGLRTPELLHTALAARHAHLLGIGRTSILCPDLPRLLKEMEKETREVGTASSEAYWSSPFRPEPDLTFSPIIRNLVPTIPLVGAGIGTAWYVVTFRRLAAPPTSKGMSFEPDYNLGPLGAVFWMWIWVDTRPTSGMKVCRRRLSPIGIVTAAFHARWPKSPLCKTLMEYERQILGLKLEAGSLGLKETLAGREVYTHVGWLALVSGAGISASTTYIGIVRSGLPALIHERVTSTPADWNAFLTMVRDININDIREGAAELRAASQRERLMEERIQAMEVQCGIRAAPRDLYY
ncbi:hypothetical protein DXG03_002274 [Asterophora parasitica]|uniref:NADH:flavin oxidoreductase/NADH oxidase N-terminal domain-containing protein n=1 Tax=Asterophora parasitica TaxID=117018 RepID=A0A9P7G2K1_9AGAR|nr:hypothetical protein DXG03_002274 [Asterophora parasitica]